MVDPIFFTLALARDAPLPKIPRRKKNWRELRKENERKIKKSKIIHESVNKWTKTDEFSRRRGGNPLNPIFFVPVHLKIFEFPPPLVAKLENSLPAFSG